MDKKNIAYTLPRLRTPSTIQWRLSLQQHSSCSSFAKFHTFIIFYYQNTHFTSKYAPLYIRTTCVRCKDSCCKTLGITAPVMRATNDNRPLSSAIGMMLRSIGLDWILMELLCLKDYSSYNLRTLYVCGYQFLVYSGTPLPRTVHWCVIPSHTTHGHL